MKHEVVLIKGDGIGPEISDAVVAILEAAGAPISWTPAMAGMAAYESTGDPLPGETLALIDQVKTVLKGPLTTPVGGGFRSINVGLRQKFDLFSNIRPAKSLPGVRSVSGEVDMVIFRENTQGLYIGREKWVDENHTVAESIGVVSRFASERIIRAAFEYAVARGRKRVTVAHKANILKLTTGLFLEVGKELAREYPQIEFNDLIIDNAAMQMVLNPHKIDVLVTTNLFGDILSDLASGLVGGLGVTGSANLGANHAMFEAVHGSAPDIAGQGKANPTALLFAATMMLDHLGEAKIADRIRKAVLATLPQKEKCTADLGGSGTTDSYAQAIIEALG
ncbi:MAG: isocitrate/isopropylmalate dehydrogenase family protein [Acidobacteria bacterium]|nr:isocitrate/isopropylmalate dehydrogenase family protein [Acidobacteriota bacterium]MCB9398938.1 isocitrate/isopropylmalate dehydrogenase family protein [Acidobacteriota bacterium]